MKQYTSRELSERLVKLGCKSQSRWYHSFDDGDPPREIYTSLCGFKADDVPAFEFEDFCGTHEQAFENCACAARKRWIINYAEALEALEVRKKIFSSEDWIKGLEKVMDDRTTP